MAAAARQEPSSRVDCAWCSRADRWPDRCPGEDQDDFCLEEVGYRCEDGDHRRCSPTECNWAEQWLVRVIDVGAAACASTGKPLTVVSTLDGDEPKVLRSFVSAAQAKPFRTAYGRKKGLVALTPIKGAVLLVRFDGVLL